MPHHSTFSTHARSVRGLEVADVRVLVTQENTGANQVNLPKGDADLEEVLLWRRQLETNYQAGLSFGFRYRFGSIFNNVVNTRFGGGGGQDRF